MALPHFGSLQREAERLGEEKFREEYGTKAWGIVRLPEAWVPPSIVVSNSVGAFLETANKSVVTGLMGRLTASIQTNLGQGPLLVRSSASNETLLDRGRFLSLRVNEVSRETLEKAIRSICEHFAATGADGKMGILLQPDVGCVAKGHLANYRRVSKTRNQWQVEVEYSEKRFYDPPAGYHREGFNSQRSEPPGSLLNLGPPDSFSSLRAELQRVAAWLAEYVEPVVSVEWVLGKHALWLVQCDNEVDHPEAVDPRSLSFPEPTNFDVDANPPSPFVEYEIGTGSRLRKLSALDDFAKPSTSSLPRIYTSDAQSLNSALASQELRASFATQIDAFAPDGVVIRSDVDGVSGQSGMNLPRTDTVAGNEAVTWISDTTAALESQGADRKNIHFLMHRFIPAYASAWSYAEPEDRYVRVDSLWGIPDGIQFFPHDTFEYDLVEQRVSRPTIDFKPFMTWARPGGEWINLRVKAQKGRSQSIAGADIAHIATFTSELAQITGRATQIMWFCGFPKWSEFELPLPWYLERHAVRPPRLEAAPPLPERRVRTVKDAADVEKDSEGQRFKLILEPDSDVIRQKTFLEGVARAAKAGGHTVVLDGSPLAHAFHQLLELGVTVHSSRSPTRRRKINKRDFGKLVRDKIPAVIEQNGDAVTFGRVPKTETRKLLVAKAFEELVELANAEEGSRVDELADLYEVLSAILNEFDISWESVFEAAKSKRTKRGGFNQGIVLVGTNLPEKDINSLLPSATLTRREVNAKRALAAATAIETRGDIASIPIARLLGDDSNAEIRIGPKQSPVQLSVSIEGDRIVVALVQSAPSKGQKTKDSDADLPLEN